MRRYLGCISLETDGELYELALQHCVGNQIAIDSSAKFGGSEIEYWMQHAIYSSEPIQPPALSIGAQTILEQRTVVRSWIFNKLPSALKCLPLLFLVC